MTTAPFVELRFNPTDLRPQDLPKMGAFLGSPAEALEAALAVTRAAMVDEMKAQVQGLAAPTHAQLLRIADLAWQGMFWRFRRISAPVIADAYVRAYRRAQAGDVPMSVIYDLADNHAEKVGGYFHESSREALADGFNSMVNRRVPARAAADRVLDAYGLTPRQMRGYTAAKQFETPILDVLPHSLKAKARAYIDKSFIGRARKLAEQEEHNIDQQAQQYAWMWLQDKGQLNERAMKLWITARDERVCEICGPLHGQRVAVNEQFKTGFGEFWTPGLHPNCRCEVRLLEHRFSKAWDPKGHPRGGDPENRGRFSVKAREAVKEREDPVIEPTSDIWESLKEAEPEEKISMVVPVEEGKISMVDQKQKISMAGGKIGMVGGTISMVGQKISMTSPVESQKISMTPEEAREKISMLTTPKMQMAMDRAVMTMLAAPKPKTPARQLTSYDRPVIRIQDDAGHEYPVYAVIRPGDLNWGGDQVELNHTVDFSPSQSWVIAQANDAFLQEIVDVADTIVNQPDLTRLKRTDGNGREWTADLDDAAVLEIVNWVAFQGRTLDPDTGLGHSIEVEYSDASGNRNLRHVPLSSLAHSLGVKVSDFDVRIVRMDEGHDSRDGTTVMSSASTKHGYEEWVTSGVYNATNYRPIEVGHNTALNIYWIDPDVELTEKPFNPND